MEQEPRLNAIKAFDVEKSPAAEAYRLLGARSPVDLSHLYTIEDQKLIRAHSWDYANEDLVVNKVKNILELLDPATLTAEESEWRQEILWFWYHHAISCAIGRYKDRDAAQRYSARALEYQSTDHPNKITRLLYFLVNDRVQDAERWGEKIDKEPERGTATELIQEYKNGHFF